MDRKKTLIGIGLLIVSFGLMFWQGKQAKELADHPALTAPVEAEKPADNADVASKTSSTNDTTQSLFASTPTEASHPDILADDNNEELLYTLENDFITVQFTNKGGAIKNVSLKKYPAVQGEPQPFIFNEEGVLPALSLSTYDNATASPQTFAPAYELVGHADNKIAFRLTTPEGMRLERIYTITTNEENTRDPYVIDHETRFTNESHEARDLKSIYVHLGTVPPVENDQMGEFLNFGYYASDKAKFIKVNEFTGRSGFLGFGQKASVDSLQENIPGIVWGSLKNQFFASVFTPEPPASGFFAQPATMPNEGAAKGNDLGITGSLKFNLGTLPAQESRSLKATYYVGPKEYTRLEALGQKQDLVMQFGIFGFISKLLLVMMNAIYSFIPNYGLAIIIVTFFIKMLTWPLTAASTRASKRMAKLQGPLKEIREKYKDSPQKAQQESMKLFKQYKVNPAAGCLPILIQIPVFLGLFWMLRSASELRFAHFLWIQDLSLPDTMAMIGPFPLNILPLIMGVTMFYQMKMTPSPSADPIQRKVFQLMPFIFLVICYNFPSGLVLYWTVQNLLTILQQYITNKRKDPEVEAIPTSLADTRKGKKKRKK